MGGALLDYLLDDFLILINDFLYLYDLLDYLLLNLSWCFFLGLELDWLERSGL